jgi:DNA mismatch endonuclease (patch repair protein)
MAGNRGRDTKPELALRSRLHALGLRYRVGLRVEADGLRVRPDVVFTRVRVAVFVDGCFWHRCLLHKSVPRRNHEFWRRKLDANVARDRRVDAALQAAGWRVVRIWEHEAVETAAARVAATVAACSPPRRGRRSTA